MHMELISHRHKKQFLFQACKQKNSAAFWPLAAHNYQTNITHLTPTVSVYDAEMKRCQNVTAGLARHLKTNRKTYDRKITQAVAILSASKARASYALINGLIKHKEKQIKQNGYQNSKSSVNFLQSFSFLEPRDDQKIFLNIGSLLIITLQLRIDDCRSALVGSD